jgi:hypothetical protein
MLERIPTSLDYQKRMSGRRAKYDDTHRFTYAF